MTWPKKSFNYTVYVWELAFYMNGKKMHFSFCSSLVGDYGDNKRWIFFCEDETTINLSGLVQVLNKYDARQVW